MTKLSDLQSAISDLHHDIPAKDRVMKAIDQIGLTDEWEKARRVVPGVYELCEESLARFVPAARQATESARKKWEKGRRERHQAQANLPLDDPRGTPTDALITRLSFTEYWCGGALVPVERILSDYLARAEVLAALADGEAEARRAHDMARKDLIVWQELKDRADASETLAAAE